MKPGEILDFALKVPLFKGLSTREVAAICSAMVPRSFKAGQIVVREDDDENQTFFVIASGTVNIAVLSSEGKQTILTRLKKGEFFGEMAILDGEPRSASVLAAEDCDLLMLYRRSFLDILRKYPTIAVRMLVEMSRRLRRTNRHINTLSLMSVYGRVADLILRLGREQGQRQGNVVVINDRPTHQEMADMVGTSRETVSRVLSQLQKRQHIAMDRKKLVILDESKLYY
ncbi:MAG: cyclic nucleotide-binding domain-containing protein [Chitinivibrionales bacterium]|nr:cyclic nucleotide-binding domain-containing protein [Chitinivibrionales bacterium]